MGKPVEVRLLLGSPIESSILSRNTANEASCSSLGFEV